MSKVDIVRRLISEHVKEIDSYYEEGTVKVTIVIRTVEHPNLGIVMSSELDPTVIIPLLKNATDKMEKMPG